MNLSADDRRHTYVLRTGRLAVVVALGFAVVATGYWFVQVVGGTDYRRLSDNNRMRDLVIPAPRGLIRDRNGKTLVENLPSYRLSFDRTLSTDFETSLLFAGRILGRSTADLASDLESRKREGRVGPLPLAEDLTLSEVAQFEAFGLEHPEFEVDVQLRRFYRHGSQTAHVLGYIGEASRTQVERSSDLRPGDLVGVKGTERSYDGRLRGVKGRRVVIVDNRNHLVEEHLRVPAERGEDLQLTLDLDLQQEAQRFFEGKAGSAVALDPRTGEVLVMVSSPAYDPNMFARRLEVSQWNRLVSAENDPLQNRAVQNSHAPGSVFKIVVGIAALEEGVVDEDYTVQCNGAARIYNQTRRCWKRGGHGRVNLHEALKHSCDVYFYNVGQKLGIDRLARYARLWGLGSVTGIDIEGEKPGLVPDPEWSLRRRNSMWYPGETISVAIGQGPFNVTPLQIAVMMAAVANGGRSVQPHIVASAEVEPPRVIDADPEVLETIHAALWAVVNDGGTGGTASVVGLDIAGKTGTAQVVNQKTFIDSAELPYKQRDHAWFASFAPVHDPQLVVVVFVEHGGHGASAAAPLAKSLYERHFGYLPDGREI